MNNSKRIAIWLPRVALITALAALVFALAVPAYVQWEHNQVLKRQIEFDSGRPSQWAVENFRRIVTYPKRVAALKKKLADMGELM
ncbi:MULTISPECIES: hypothetical protein [Halomonas]|uniref:hypothetical protein n=1 Tax=Halomonas TaxID=2745 RepID=UPI003CF345B8